MPWSCWADSPPGRSGGRLTTDMIESAGRPGRAGIRDQEANVRGGHRPGHGGGAGVAPVPLPRRRRSSRVSTDRYPAHRRVRAGLAAVLFPLVVHARRRAVPPGRASTSSGKNLPAQVTRMLADPRSGEFFRNFVGQWLQARDVDTVLINAAAVLSRATSPATPRPTSGGRGSAS